MWLFPIRAFAALIASLVVSMTGCGDDEAANNAAPTIAAASSDATAPGQDLVDVVSDDLGRRLNVDLASLDVVERCAMLWPDGSAGVAEPGMFYTQAQVPGWLIILEVAGNEYRYHGAGDRFVAADFVAGATVEEVRCP